MSFILTPAAFVAPEGPSSMPTNESRSLPDRAPTFGPALSDARQRLASPDARRFDPDRRRSTGSERPDRADRPERSPERPERAPRSDRYQQPDRTGRNSERDDRAGAVDDAHAADRPEPDAVEEEPTASETTQNVEEAPAAEVAESNTPTPAEAAMAATLVSTADGAAGEGDPLIDLTVEAVAAPELVDESTPAAETDTSVIEDGVTGVDIEAMTGSPTDIVEPEVAEMGRQAALTSLEQVSDADLSLADRIRPATTEEVAGPSISVDDSARADPFSQSLGEEASNESPLQGAIEETNTERAATANNDAAVEATPDATVANEPRVRTEALDRPVPQVAINTATQTDSPDAVVVLAREATAPAEGVKAASAPTTQATAPLPTAAEANLWEDVRSAFDRIRATGDGQEVRMRLRPAELGELLVQVRTQGDHVSVRLVTSSAAAQQTLVDDRLRLAAELARAGFDEGSVDIGQSDTGDANQRRDQSGDGRDADRAGQSFGAATGLDRVGTGRDIFERREPIRTESGFRPGRTAQSTINITL